MRRLITAGSALLVATGVVLVLPVTGPSTPGPEPVRTSVTEVALGSVEDPAEDVVVEQPEEEAPAAPAAPPTLRVSRPDVADFSLVGVTWAHDPDVVDVAVRIRVRDRSGTWSGWTEAGVEDAAAGRGGPAERRGGTEPLWTGESSGVEAEVTTPSGASPVDVRLDLIDPGTSAADEVPGTPEIQDTADAAEAMPDVYSRAQWGADERLRTWKPQYAGVLKAATIHHTAGANGYAAGDVAEIMRGIYRYHAVSLGWGDIGYNVLVDRFGRLWEGRAGGLASTVIGAHAGGFNTGTFGISMIGNYDVVDTTPAMIQSVARIAAWKLSLYGIDPLGTTVIEGGGSTSRWENVTQVRLPTIFGHIDVKATACPGRYGVAKMPQIRALAAGGYVDVTAISDRYTTDEPARTLLGPVVTAPTLTATGTGAYANYQNGSLYYSARTGVQIVRGAVRTLWRSTGAETGPLGFPNADVAATADGAGLQGRFQRGSIWWTQATGSRALLGPIESLWRSTGAERGPLRYPVHSVSNTADGSGQYAHFQGGSVYWSATTGPRALLGPVLTLWNSTGGLTGPLGYPTTSLSTAPDGTGRYAEFEHGSIYWSQGTGARALLGPVEALWNSTGGPKGLLGYPTTSVTATADGAGQFARFQNGSIFWSPATGARALVGPIEDHWESTGGLTGDLGYPTNSVATAPDGAGQYAHFQGGSVYWSEDTGARVVAGKVRELWLATRQVLGPLGYPIEDVRPTQRGDGEVGRFEGGSIWWTQATGARALLGPIETLWTSLGGEDSNLGYPTQSVTTTAGGAGQFARFTGGSIWWSQATGAHALSGPVESLWRSTGAESGPLGFPTSDVTPAATGGGQYARFQHGSIWWSQETGARALLGPVDALWASTGGERGVLGYPTQSTSAARDGVGRYARFVGGSIWWSPTTGARALLGPIEEYWTAAGAERGSLGYPTQSVSIAKDGAGRYAAFQRGAVAWSPTTVARSVSGTFLTAWKGAGRETGALGYPTGEAYRVAGGTWQDFQGGRIKSSDATGRTWIERR